MKLKVEVPCTISWEQAVNALEAMVIKMDSDDDERFGSYDIGRLGAVVSALQEKLTKRNKKA